MMLITLNVSAQIKREAVFDFTKPTELTPSITPRSDNGGALKVSDKVFTNGLVSISFVEGNQITGAQIVTGIDSEWGQTYYHLRLTTTTQMIFSCSNGATLDSIRISHDSSMGDFWFKDDNQPGTIDASQGFELWKSAPSSNVSKVEFLNGAYATEFHKVTVYYKENASTLNASFNIPSGSTLTSFESLNLTYPKNISLVGNSSLNVIDSNGHSVGDLNITTSGTKATLALNNALIEKGNYKIIIPEGMFKDNNGYVNERQIFSFTIEPSKNTFNYINSYPEVGKITKLSDKFYLEFPDEVGFVSEKPLILFKDGKAKRSVSMSKEGDKVIFSFLNVTEGLTENGEYTLTIPEGYIYNAFKGLADYELYNQEFTLTYIIGDKEPSPGPSDDSEIMKLAKSLLDKSEVGYPSASSNAFLKLKEAVESSATPSDDELTSLINEYYNEESVNLPQEGKWYKLASINSEGNSLFFTMDSNGKLAFTKDQNQALAFLAKNEGTKLSLQDQQGKFFFVNGLTDDKGKDLTISKFKISDVDAKSVLGLLDIYGYCTTNSEDDDLFAHALVNHTTSKLATDVTASKLHFSDKLSNAFLFVETVKPTEEIEAVETSFNISPDVASSNKESLTLSVTNTNEVSVSENADIYFATTIGLRNADATLVPVSGYKNKFTISLGTLADGKHCLVIPEGTFFYMKDGKTVKNKEYTKLFSIGKHGSGDDGNFDYDFESFYIYNSPGQDIPIKDVELNDFTLYITKNMYSGLYADPNKTVRLVNYKNADITIRSGHFDSCEIDVYNSMAIKWVCDNPIVEGELPPGMYTFIIEPGTFGDANFKKYLDDKTSVSASACKVNPDSRIHFTVNNDKVTGIKEVSSDTNRPTVIYDLMGRRVQEMTRPGIYIVNGKKVIKK